MEVELLRVLILLLVLGILYNGLVSYSQQQLPQAHGLTALFVVGGCLFTIAAAALIIGVADALVVLLCFVASGTPMVAGSILRYLDRCRERAR